MWVRKLFSPFPVRDVAGAFDGLCMLIDLASIAAECGKAGVFVFG